MSVNIEPMQFLVAEMLAKAVQRVSQESDQGLGNFRLCASACCYNVRTPFFPAAAASMASQHDTKVTFSVGVGLENGGELNDAVTLAKTSQNLSKTLKEIMLPPLECLEARCKGSCERASAQLQGIQVTYAGIDVSFNPSLDDGMHGSVAAALQNLVEVSTITDIGSLSAVASATQALQKLPVQQVGYCGLMLPVCEDHCLAMLASGENFAEVGFNASYSSDSSSAEHHHKTERKTVTHIPPLTLQTLLFLSSVCGVGIDTVPITGDFSPQKLARLYLDVSGLANRWQKPLSCRVFPVPGKQTGQMTTFSSPYLVNTRILPL